MSKRRTCTLHLTMARRLFVLCSSCSSVLAPRDTAARRWAPCLHPCHTHDYTHTMITMNLSYPSFCFSLSQLTDLRTSTAHTYPCISLSLCIYIYNHPYLQHMPQCAPLALLLPLRPLPLRLVSHGHLPPPPPHRGLQESPTQQPPEQRQGKGPPRVSAIAGPPFGEGLPFRPLRQPLQQRAAHPGDRHVRLPRGTLTAREDDRGRIEEVLRGRNESKRQCLQREGLRQGAARREDSHSL